MSLPSVPARVPLARRSFLKLAGLAGLALSAPGSAARAFAADGPPAPAALPEGFPRQSAEVVSEVVGVAHGNFARLRELVDARPALAKAAWDWGFGDWESALGAASHVGRRDIAEYLIGMGARPSVFSAAMLGQLAVVRAFVEADPGVVALPGPHGIPLIAHARAGGDAAKATLAYLESVPGHPERPAGPDEAERADLAGRYAYGPAAADVFEVAEKNGALMLTPAGHPARGLVRLGRGRYHPAGAPAVEVVFAPGAGRAESLVVRDGPDIVLTAARAEA